MSAVGESRDEATSRKMGVLSTKPKTRIGFWNVRTMVDQKRRQRDSVGRVRDLNA